MDSMTSGMLIREARLRAGLSQVELSDYLGQVVLVVRSGATPRQAVQEAIEQVGPDRDVSLILNQGRVSLSGGYYGYSEYGSHAQE